MGDLPALNEQLPMTIRTGMPSWQRPRNTEPSSIRRSVDMSGQLPAGVAPGQIYRHHRFYRDRDDTSTE